MRREQRAAADGRGVRRPMGAVCGGRGGRWAPRPPFYCGHGQLDLLRPRVLGTDERRPGARIMPTAVDMQALFNADGVVKLRRRGAPTALWSCGDAEERAMGRARSAARRRAAGAGGVRSLGGTSMAAAWCVRDLASGGGAGPDGGRIYFFLFF
ncbi:uncharacterized protein LOC120707502 [Panicum virgatum]|uniref:Uncharacterized protein n=1 Tax=Panicum virgatum TaxID=38727 RepID=A0A8T0ST26_PANVG|nr:uncharacterized protein LOC120707502 [Panicum virgatum]KAG2599289.1 hypothetical protein PVAP13_5KG380121 [Panicum virgatum]